MFRMLIITRRHLVLAGVVVACLLAVWMVWSREPSVSAGGPAGGERIVHMVTGEFKSTLPDGKEIEAYRWDPGTVVVHQGDHVKLSITGINGDSHPFLIEGLNIKGEVKKGKETIVTFDAAEEGIYRIICLAHTDAAHNGPMIGYIVVE